MKIKKILTLLLPTAFLLSACSNQDNIAGSDSQANDGAIEITFPGRTLAPITYAGTYPADVTEKALSNARVYVFSDNNGQPDKLLQTEVLTLTAGGDSEVGVKGKFYMRQDGVLHLLATANLSLTKKEIERLEGKTFKEVSKALITQDAGKANFFPMCATAPVKVTIPDVNSNSPRPKVSFILERLSARIDIENLTTAKNGEFVLTGARLRQSINQSYLVKGQTPELYCDDNLGSSALAIGPFVTNKGVSGDMKKMYMQLYTYENKENQLIVDVQGTYKGQKADFSIPFTGRKVKRNTRYIVQLRNAEDLSHVTFNIVEVKDWDEGGVSTLKPGADAAIPTVTSIAATNDKGTAVAAHHTANNAEVNKVTSIKVETPEAYYLKVNVESWSVESRILLKKAEYPWISVSELGKANISGGKLQQTFLVKIGKNVDLYDRSAVLEVQNAYAPNKVAPKLITLTQKAATTSLNPVAYVAKAYVTDLNTFGPVVTDDNFGQNNLGKRYQWGRNKTDLTGGEEKASMQPTDARLWNSNKVFFGDNIYMYNSALPSVKSWKEAIAKSTNAPASYIGNNDGDPSPKGWHLPTLEEAMVIAYFPNSFAETQNFFSGAVNAQNIKETVKFHEEKAPLAITSDYYSTKKNVAYALRFKGANNKYLTAFKYTYRYPGVIIQTRYLGKEGASVKVQDIANENYWNQDAGSDVVRYLIGDLWGGFKASGRPELGLLKSRLATGVCIETYFYQNYTTYILPFRN